MVYVSLGLSWFMLQEGVACACCTVASAAAGSRFCGDACAVRHATLSIARAGLAQSQVSTHYAV